MRDDRHEAGSALAALQERLLRLEQRVAALEARPRQAAPETSEEVEAIHLPALPRGGLALAGRALLVLAGAYVFRALTDAGVLPALVGAAIGLAYAVFWLLQADRDARRGARASATVHGAAACAVAFPLVFETTARFGLLRAAGASAAVVGFAALGLLVAFRQRLSANAWLTTLAACATLVALLATTRDAVTALVALLGLAALVEWLAFHDAWLGLRWCAAATLDTVALLLIAIGTRPEPPASDARLSALQPAAALVALSVLYVASIAARTLRRGCPVRAFEVVQGTLAVAIGLGGARLVLAAHGFAALLPALFAVSLGVVCYAVAFAFAERRPGQGRNFYFYATAGGLLMLGGTRELGMGAALPLLWTGLGIAAVALGRRFGRTTLRVHGALYLAAAALDGGLAAAGARALFGLPPAAVPPLGWAIALGAGVAWGVLAGEADGPHSTPRAARLSRLLLALLLVLALAEAARLLLGAVLGEALAADPGTQAVARSAVLVALVLALATLARRSQPELAGLAYALLAAGGLKLLQDVRGGRPATLVASFALYGSLLILVPRLLPGRKRPA
jgi:hypothetical protein